LTGFSIPVQFTARLGKLVALNTIAANRGRLDECGACETGQIAIHWHFNFMIPLNILTLYFVRNANLKPITSAPSSQLERKKSE